MTGKLINLDDHRPKVYETMRCLFCNLVHTALHPQSGPRTYFPCPGCDEVASVPEWRWGMQ